MCDSLKLVYFGHERNINRYGIECIPIDRAKDRTLAIENIELRPERKHRIEDKRTVTRFTMNST